MFAAFLLAATVPAAEDGVTKIDQPQIIVTGRRAPVRSTSTATKTDTPLRDVPQAISVIDSTEIAARSLQSIADVLRTVPGATVASGEGHRDQILLRGQSTTADFFVDGIRDDVQYYRPLYNLDRVEVLKGPNALIFGRGGGGGIVNRVTKKAGLAAFANGNLSLDSEGAFSGSSDFEAPLTGTLGARLNTTAERFDSFRDHVGGHRLGLNPTLGWQPGEGTRVDLSYEYAHDRRVTDRGIPSFDGRPLQGAQEQFFGDPDVNRLRFDAHVADLAVHQRIGGIQWTAKARAGAYDKFYRNALAATALQANGTVGIEAYQSRTKRDAFFLQNDFVADAETGALKHKLLFGADLGFQSTFSDRQQGYFDGSPAVSGGTRLFVPLAMSDDLPTITFRDGAARAASAGDSDARAIGLYVQDQVEVGRHLEIVGGLRRDWFRLRYDDRLSPLALTRRDARWSPRLGIVVKPDEALSLYASWSKSFLPQSGDQFSSLTPSTAALAPEEFRNREIGLKWAATPAIDVTLAAYILDRDNTRATDPQTNLTVLTGAERSKGIEASAGGRVGRAWSFSASAALQDAEIRRTTSAAPAGRKIASVPHFTASLWGRYDFNDRFGIGLGAYRQSKSYASISNAVVVPGYTRFDAAAFFDLTDKIALQVNVENLLDRDYVGLSHTDNNLTPGAPRTVRATLRFGI